MLFSGCLFDVFKSESEQETTNYENSTWKMNSLISKDDSLAQAYFDETPVYLKIENNEVKTLFIVEGLHICNSQPISLEGNVFFDKTSYSEISQSGAMITIVSTDTTEMSKGSIQTITAEKVEPTLFSGEWTQCLGDTLKTANENVYVTMKDVYLWHDKIPDVNPNAFATPESLLDELRYDLYDKWSFIIDNETYALYAEGESYGHGLVLKYRLGLGFVLGLVFENSELYREGLRRGDVLQKINGIDTYELLTSDGGIESMGADTIGVQNSFTFEKPDGTTIEKTFTKELIQKPNIVADSIYTLGEKSVGYVMFHTFRSDGIDELTSLFNVYQERQIDELVIDLRYNSGGDLDVATHFASLVAGSQYDGSVFGYVSNNNKRTEYDRSEVFTNSTLDLGLKRVFFITSPSTASASELLINGLKPYMEVVLVGRTTSGKPVGMYTIPLGDHVLFPIMFSVENSDHVGDYFEGLSSDIYAVDTYKSEIGDIDESLLSKVLETINGENVLFKQSLEIVEKEPEFLTGFALHRGFL